MRNSIISFAETYKSSQSGYDFTPLAPYPDIFCESVLGVNLWSKQSEIINAANTRQFCAYKSGHKCGKTLASACLALFWICTRVDGKVLLTSSSDTQIKHQLWPEFKRVYRAAQMPLGGILLETHHGGLQFGDGREVFGISTNTTERMAGYSGKELLIIADEASGIDETIYEALFGNVAGGGHMLLLGNPTQPSGSFYKAFSDDSWTTGTVSSWDVPGGYTGLATREWCQNRLNAWGPNDARYMVRVLGEFPEASGQSVFGLDDIRAAQQRWGARYVGAETLVIGVDVARFGDDDSVIQPRRGAYAYEPTTVHGQDTQAVAATVEAVAVSLGGSATANVDVIGVGAGVADALRKNNRVRVNDVNVAGKAKEEEYGNLRAELHFRLKEWLKTGAIAKHEETEEEMATVRYKFSATGKIMVEGKDELKKRLHRSPDRLDALTLSVYDVPVREDVAWVDI